MLEEKKTISKSCKRNIELTLIQKYSLPYILHHHSQNQGTQFFFNLGLSFCLDLSQLYDNQMSAGYSDNQKAAILITN